MAHADQIAAQQLPESATRPQLPSLPPRMTAPPVPADNWTDVEPATGHSRHAQLLAVDEREPARQLWTQPPRIIVTIGLLAILAAAIIQIEVLWPTFREGLSGELRISPGESAAFRLALTVSCLCLPLGWLWWATAAAVNARRLSPLTTSPFLPAVVFVVAPIVFAVASQMSGGVRDFVFVTAWLLSVFSYFIVFASLRGTAMRISASVTQFSRMLWLPLAWIGYRLSMFSMLSFYDGPGNNEWLLLAVVVVELIFPAFMVLTTWRAFGSFSAACRRLNRRYSSIGLPSMELATRAIRQQVVGHR